MSTRYGDIEGFVTIYPNASGRFKSVSKFLGVPFSAPPTGELRFKASQPPKEWKPKVYSAKTHGSVCLQPKLFENLIEPFSSNFTSLAMFAPWRSQNPVRKTWVSDYWKIIHYCCAATEGSEQQHNQDLKEIYKGRRILEFITFYHNALHLTTFFTTMRCI